MHIGGYRVCGLIWDGIASKRDAYAPEIEVTEGVDWRCKMKVQTEGINGGLMKLIWEEYSVDTSKVTMQISQGLWWILKCNERKVNLWFTFL